MPDNDFIGQNDDYNGLDDYWIEQSNDCIGPDNDWIGPHDMFGLHNG